MTKAEFISYLPNYTSGIFSTVREDGMPEARGWEFQFEEDGRYYFGTANTKEVFKQLQAHPQAAFTYMEPQGKFTVRITGDVKIVTDAAEKARLWAKIDPLVQKMYKSVDNPVFEIICLENCTCKLANGFGIPKVVE